MQQGIGLVSLKIIYTKQAQKDAKKLAAAEILAGAYSRRINIQHRLVYQVLESEKQVKVLRLWSHYE